MERQGPLLTMTQLTPRAGSFGDSLSRTTDAYTEAALLKTPFTGWKKADLDIHKYTAKVVQGFGTIFFRILYRTIFNIEIIGKENIAHQQGPVIIVSNHVVFYDSFMFHMFFSPTASLLPLRFMAVRKFDHKLLNFFYSIGVIPLVYMLFGVFTVTQGIGREKNLENAKDILSRNGTVTIFPSGRMHSDNSLGHFKKGAADLALSTNTPIIPIAIKRLREKGKRTKFTINVGKKFLLEDHLSLEDATIEIFKEVEGLHNKII
jgi:1-acyl-sn-glycerol-3-phosphate acyltransferase